MDEMPSAQFRKQYASLKTPVVVTVNGHMIGTWLPTGTTITLNRGAPDGEPHFPRDVAGYSTRPFTPVPKKVE